DNLIALACKPIGQRKDQARFVFNEQHFHWTASRIAGISSVTFVPRPGRLSTEIVPPCASTISLTSESPRPLPWIWASITSRERKNGSNIRFTSLPDIPMPWSSTEILTVSPPLNAATVSCGSLPPYLIPFEI